MNEIFSRKHSGNYNLRRHPQSASRAINPVLYVSESLSFGVPKIWEMLTNDLKKSRRVAKGGGGWRGGGEGIACV